MMSVRTVLALSVTATWLGGCAIGGFDLSGSPTSSAPPEPVPAVATAPPAPEPPQPMTQSAAMRPAPQPAAIQPQSHAEAMPPAPQPAVAQSSRQLPAGRGARTPPTPPPQEAVDQGPMTTTRAREVCWMETEENAKLQRDMDAKIKFVEKCVDQKMRAAGQ
ncbi:MAG: hypothetical protein ACXU80_03150 [Xanthobacteraceae bacterium]